MFFEKKVSEPKPSKCGRFTVRQVKLGNKIVGTIESPKLKPGMKAEAVYWAGETIIRLSPSRLSLVVNRARLGNMRMYGVQKVGLRTADGTVYLIEHDKLTAMINSAAQGIIEAVLPHTDWEITEPSEEDRVANTMGKVRIAGRRPLL